MYAWALVPALAALLVAAALGRPAVAAGEWRALDWLLVVALAAAAFQLVPLPPAARALLSPAARDFDQRVGIVAPPAERWQPLSLAPEAWLWGAGLAAAAVVCFWIAREAAHAHGARLLARMISWMGLAASLLAIVSPSLFPSGRIYGVWEPQSSMAHPAGPFVSRNHFATWLVVAAPLAAGYFIAHMRTHWLNRKRRMQILGDARALWLIAAGALMTTALFVTQSRAGMLAFAGAAAFGLSRGWRRATVAGRAALIGYTALLLTAAIVWASPDLVINRFGQALEASGWGGRPEIWRETLDLCRRFWFAGVGLGAFDIAMAVYQTATYEVLFNHAHNQYLHTLAEGGAIVAVPAAAAVVAFVRVARRRIAADTSPMAHVREGALAGVFGLAIQSAWEAPLLTPAVLLLAATAAGIAVHAPPEHLDAEGAR